MRTSTQMKCVCAAALAASGIIIATVALASPPTNFTGEGLVAADLTKLANVNAVGGIIKFETTKGTDTSIVKLIFGANGRSGWHRHPGMVLVQVAQGRERSQMAHAPPRPTVPGSPTVRFSSKAKRFITSAAVPAPSPTPRRL